MLDESINRGKLLLLPEICGIDENKSRVIEKIIDYIRLISKYAHERKKENRLLLLYITRRDSYIRK